MTMPAHVSKADISQPLIDTATWRDVLKLRTRWYQAQREAGVSPVGVFILDVIALGQLEGFATDIEALADILDLPKSTIRQPLVELIKGGLLEVDQSASGARLGLSEKGNRLAHDMMRLAFET